MIGVNSLWKHKKSGVVGKIVKNSLLGCADGILWKQDDVKKNAIWYTTKRFLELFEAVEK